MSYAVLAQRLVRGELSVALVASKGSDAQMDGAHVLVHVAVRFEASRTVIASERLAIRMRSLVYSQILARVGAMRTLGAREVAVAGVCHDVRTDGAVRAKGLRADL